MPEPRKVREGPPPRPVDSTSGGLDLGELAEVLAAAGPPTVARRGPDARPKRTAVIRHRMRLREEEKDFWA